MKRSVILIFFLAACLSLEACLKDTLSKNGSPGGTNSTNNNTNNGAPIPVTLSGLLGKWALVNDSTTTNFWGIWSGRAPQTINYIGKPADYYNFTSYNKLYVHENTVIDTQTYMLSHDTVLCKYAYIDGQTNQLDSAYGPRFVITQFSGQSCTLTSFFISPETASFSTINLRK